MMEELTVKLRILARAELTLLKADAHRRTNQLVLFGLAIGCMLVALAFLNTGAFFVLTEAHDSARAAFILAAANFGLGLIPFFMARNSKAGPEEAMVREIREMAAAEISRDVAAVSDEFRGLVSSVKEVQRGISGLAGGHGGTLSAVAPLLPTIIELLKKARK